jgi:hypothetical protein
MERFGGDFVPRTIRPSRDLERGEHCRIEALHHLMGDDADSDSYTGLDSVKLPSIGYQPGFKRLSIG